jgi:hypothetical protein
MLTSEEMHIKTLAARLHWVPSYSSEHLHSYPECLARAALHFEQMRMLLSPAPDGHDWRQLATHCADAADDDGVCEFIRVHLGLSTSCECRNPRCERGAQGNSPLAESRHTRAFFKKRARAPERRTKASRKAARKERDVGRPRNATLCDDANESDVE